MIIAHTAQMITAYTAHNINFVLGTQTKTDIVFWQ